MSTLWRVRSGDVESGPYTESEVADLIRKGLYNAVVKSEGGTWAHLSMSPFAQLIRKPSSGQGWKIGAIVAFVLVAGLTLGTWFVRNMEKEAQQRVEQAVGH
jgi:hypothetical protein